MEATTYLYHQIRRKRYYTLMFLYYDIYFFVLMSKILCNTQNYTLELQYIFQVVLLLLLAEAMASKHVPLNQTPEYDAHR